MATNHDLKQKLNQKQLDKHIDKPLEELQTIAEDYKKKNATPPQGILVAIERAEIEEDTSPEAVKKRREEAKRQAQAGTTDEAAQ